MVFVGVRQEQEREDSKASQARFSLATATAPERSRSLHNFSLPRLKWGGQRQLRCVKADDDSTAAYFGASDRRSWPPSSNNCNDSGGLARSPPEPERSKRSFFEAAEFGGSSSRFKAVAEIGRKRPAVDCDGDDGIKAVGKRLMLDLQAEMGKMKSAVLSKGGEGIEPPPARMEAPLVAEARPWNLRTRRAVCKEPIATGGGGAKNKRIDEGNCSFSPEKGALKLKGPRTKLSVSLSKQEIEEDFIAITGIRPPRKPKKRPRHIQKQLDTLFPGLWLSEVTTDMYKVDENPQGGKKQ